MTGARLHCPCAVVIGPAVALLALVVRATGLAANDVGVVEEALETLTFGIVIGT
jgi:hypothetical protein